MYNDVVAPECFLPRNIRENFAVDLREIFLQTFRAVENKEERNIRIDDLKNHSVRLDRKFFTVNLSGNEEFAFYQKFYPIKKKSAQRELTIEIK